MARTKKPTVYPKNPTHLVLLNDRAQYLDTQLCDPGAGLLTNNSWTPFQDNATRFNCATADRFAAYLREQGLTIKMVAV